MTTEELLKTVEEIHVPLEDTYLNVIRFGRGKKVLALLSGVSLCGLEGAGAGVAAAYADFAEEYTVYLFDRKKLLPKGYQVADMAEDVYRVLCTFGIQEADVYGVSQGGMMGLSLALAHPGLVRKLALCSTQARAGSVMR
ncbi:MAG: alpha/beta hydrolase [Clostridia bacterium]|nr:alpha/beta hydrolase [Clostridia bacterium]